MSEGREGTVLSKNVSDIQEIEARRRSYSESQKAIETKHDPAEHRRLSYVFEGIYRDLVNVKANTLLECKLKPSVLKNMMSDFQEDDYLNYFIENEADAYEAVAMSVVRDLLQLDRPSDEVSSGRSSEPKLGGVPALLMRPPA